MYSKVLLSTINILCEKKKGILAADESINTIGKRFNSINLDNNLENRIKYRKLLFSTKDLNKYISGVILFSETLENKDLTKLLIKQNILLGIKTDLGLKDINELNNEKITNGLLKLDERSKNFYHLGARFAKFRVVFNIDIKNNKPSNLAIKLNSEILAKYAKISQENGLVPIVEPEILMDGNHTIEDSENITRKILSKVFNELIKENVELDKILLKPNMVRPGTNNSNDIYYNSIAKLTLNVLQDTVPVSVPGIFFLSGGMSEEQSSLVLNSINLIESKKPWYLSFSYGRALQQSALRLWNGDENNIEIAQKELLEKCKNNSLATSGEYIDNIV